MADGLSLAASIFAVLGAADGLSRVLSQIRRLRHAPNELLALINEVSDLRIVLGGIQTYAIQNEYDLHLSQNHVRDLMVLTDRAKETVLELDKLIHYRLIKPQHGTVKLAKTEWLKGATRVERLRHQLRDSRLNIATQMVLINSSYQTRIGLSIDEIRIISAQVSANKESSNRTSQRLDEHSRVLGEILQTQATIQHQTQLPCLERTHLLPNGTVGAPSTLLATQRPDTLVRIRAHAYQSQRYPCLPYCKCACHNVRHFRSTKILQNAVGALLFIGYSGYPFQALQECTEGCYVSKSSFQVDVYYVFPAWLLAKALVITFGGDPLEKINMSLSVRGIISSQSEIFRFVRSDDVDGIKECMRLGLASPNDSNINGASLLLVREQIPYIRDKGLAWDHKASSVSVQDRKWNACDLLLKAGADPYLTVFGGVLSPFISAWNMILDGSCTPSEADIVRSLFPDQTNALDERDFSPIHKTILKLEYCNINQQIRAYHNQINSPDSDGHTALMWAARRDDTESLNLLVQAGADVHLRNHRGMPALHHAARASREESVRLLLSAGADPRQLDTFGGWSALHQAAYSANPAGVGKVKCLIQAGADPDAKTKLGGTPLQRAAFTNNALVAKALLDNGADIRTVDNDGDSALFQSIRSQADDVTLLLLSRKADYKAWDSRGNSVLHGAALWGSCRTLDILHDAELHDIDPHARNRQDRTPLQLALARAHKPEGFIEKLQELLTDIRIRNTELKSTTTAIQTVESRTWIHWLTKKLQPMSTSWRVPRQHHFQGRYRRNASSTSGIPIMNIMLLTALVALALGLLGLLPRLLSFLSNAFGLNRLLQVVAFAWSVLGPGDALEL